MLHEVDSRYAWFRLGINLALMTIGASGMYVVVVVLPSVQAEFGVARGEASLPYTLTMIGFGLGGIVMGRLADRFGILVPSVLGAVALSIGFVAAAFSPSLLVFAILQGAVIGFLGSSSTFSPLMADTSFWFLRRRGIAVAICAAGNYLGGAIWPTVVQAFVEDYGWRNTYVGIGIFCLATMLPLALMLRAPRPQATALPLTEGEAAKAAAQAAVQPAGIGHSAERPLGMTPRALLTLLCIAGVACCVAMSMPQVHIVAYCADLGYGPARGAEMLSLMLGFGIVSRLISGMICDRIGGLRTLLLGSVMQTIALVLFLPFDSLASLYVISILFGLFQGGIVPSYAIVVREYFSPRLAGTWVGLVITSTMVGMALGGWLSGAIFDLTGSYDAAFVNGIAWNVVNAAIVLWLLRRAGGAGLLRPLRAPKPAIA
ncbi:MFS transporter [Burkholderiaceae bacterium FT117]|uniref:MFS transporter n=1 Tax=Zeimonas sediminis TaxID=2944268 RepID=UPI002342BE9C|nr:MFS transporter [Zeimonas sediminis]MCM5571427.1 MFS transporter [Zeimonas sediminis]